MIRVYNTLTRTKEPFQTVRPGKVGIYLCGPTVYKPSHIGHMVGPVVFDAIKRYLTYNGYEVTWVINITDVDDKLIARAHERGITVAQLAEEMTADYMECLRVMGVEGVDHFPRATEYIPAMIAFIERLAEKGCAYVSDGDVYFDVSRFPEYGKLSRRSLEQMQIEGGTTAERKRSGADFALWKGAKPGEPSWPSPWGPGRPGWHIECSVMSGQLLGETFDIHGGGLDLVFPHHENEIAQSEACHGKPMARYWMHNGLMQASDEVGKVGGRTTRPAEGDQEAQEAGKIAGRHGAQSFLLLLREQGFTAEQVRFFLLSTHYRRPIDFSVQRIREVGVGLESFYRFFQRFRRITGEDFYQVPFPRRRSEGELASALRLARSEAPRRLGGAWDNCRTPQPLPGSHGRRLQHRGCGGGAVRIAPPAEQVRRRREARRPAGEEPIGRGELAARGQHAPRAGGHAGVVSRPAQAVRPTRAQPGGPVAGPFGRDPCRRPQGQELCRGRQDPQPAGRAGRGAGGPAGRHRVEPPQVSTPAPDCPPGSFEGPPRPLRVLGVDPGLHTTGYGVLEARGRTLCLCEAGVVRAKARGSLACRLAEIHDGIREVIASLSPDVLALEELYSHYGRPRTAILMGHARGVICLAAAQAGLAVVSYSATQVKKVLTGSGRAPKSQVQRAIRFELGLAALPEPPDVADALAIALCHHYLHKTSADLHNRG